MPDMPWNTDEFRCPLMHRVLTKQTILETISALLKMFLESTQSFFICSELKYLKIRVLM